MLLLLGASMMSSQNWKWIRSAGGDKSDKGIDIDVDRYGNQYVSGYYNTSSSGNVMFSGLIGQASFGKEGFLAKIDSAGNWKWVSAVIGGWDERVLGSCVDNVNDFVYITGTCWNYTDVGTYTIGTFPGSNDNIFVAKLDLNGNCQWVIGAGSFGDDHGYDLVTDKAGNIYLTGFLSPNASGATFGSQNVPSFSDSAAFVAKITPAGNFKWVRTFHGVDGERDNRIAIDDNANVYVTGSYYGTRAYNTATLTSNGGQDIYVIKLDSAGNEIWVRSAGGVLDDRGNSLTVDSRGNIYVAGEFRDIVVFGTDTVNNYGGPNGRDIFVAKITNTGNWKWASKAGSSNGSDRGNRVVSNGKDLLFVTGQIKGSATFGALIANVNPLDSVQVFAAAIDTSGIWRWVKHGGGKLEDRGSGIAVDEMCNVYVTGYFQDTVSFGPYIDTALNRKDIFVAKISSDCNAVGIGIQENEVLGNMILFPNPSTGKFILDLGNYRNKLNVMVYNMLGEELQNYQINSGDKTEININHSSGVYFIRLIGNSGAVKTFKVIKE